ncbi:MAG: AAA family ATPase [Victivallales bacterium]|nr:AAA family ATPase [Victivallales bacterium]
MSELKNQLKAAVDGLSPIVYLFSPEEKRMTRAISELAGATPIHTWSCIYGLDNDPATTAPVEALIKIIRENMRGFIVFLDLAPFMSNPEVVRALRDAYYDGQDKPDRTIFLICAEHILPEALKKEVHFIEVPLPDSNDIHDIIISALEKHQDYHIPKEAIRDVTMALKGLTENEIEYVLARACRNAEASAEQLMDEIFSEKKNVVKKSGFLEFAPPKWKIDGIGGLDNLKNWLLKRQHMFTQEAADAGVPVPKGLLIMGVSGCGKSLCIKTISSLWNIPMFRLDMNLVFSGMYGSPEEAFHRALKTIESVAPAVLWIDEIENALGLDDSGQRISPHIFSSFLTWMQEKPPLIFIAATANKITALPAEILRKGRFDEVFFCDLPAKEERAEILRIHLLRNNANPDDFDFKMLQIMTEGWNGAEIEQAIISARTEAFFEKREFNQHDLENVMARIVPLSDTMEQQIKAIRSWAFSRATPASKYGKNARH